MRVRRFVEWVLASVGCAICISDAMLTWIFQSSSPSGSLWPLPALVLIEMALLGLAGILAVVLDSDERTLRWGRLTWAICGGLTALMVIGAFSIGPLLFWAILAFALAGFLANRRRARKFLYDLGIFMLGAVCNAAILLLLIVIAGTVR